MIIFLIISTINILKFIGLWRFIINILKIPLSYLGMSEKVANIILIGLTLGISFGGGFLIEESKKLDHSSAVKKYEYLENKFPNQVCLLHGKTDVDEK